MNEPLDRMAGLLVLYDIEKVRWETLRERLEDYVNRLESLKNEGTQLYSEATECSETMAGLTRQIHQVTNRPRLM